MSVLDNIYAELELLYVRQDDVILHNDCTIEVECNPDLGVRLDRVMSKFKHKRVDRVDGKNHTSFHYKPAGA